MNPTTPFAKVARIGAQLAETGKALGVEAPSLAHHDAGGTTYRSDIRLIDLGGLGDRAVAKNMGNADFIAKYLFEEEKPTFIFGASHNFAAGTKRIPGSGRVSPGLRSYRVSGRALHVGRIEPCSAGRFNGSTRNSH